MGEYVRYDLIKEFVVALAVITALAVILAILFSSPDDKPTTIQQWARSDPGGLRRHRGHRAGRDERDRHLRPALQQHPRRRPEGLRGRPRRRWPGVHYRIDTAKDFVLDPLRSIPGNATLKRGARRVRGRSAEPAERAGPTRTRRRSSTPAFRAGCPVLPAGRYGPVAPMMSSRWSAWPQSGGLDGALLTSSQFYQTNYTKPLLFLSGGGFFETRAEAQHLLGTQWGMMNETGSYPGQVWLWLYTFWYQIAPFNTSDNADAQIFAADDGAQPRVHLHPLHPRAAKPAAAPRRPPADLARPLPARRGRPVAQDGRSNELHR